MKILIAAASFSSRISGIQRHGFNLAHCLLQSSDVAAIHVVVAPWQRSLIEAAGLVPSARLAVHIAEMKPSVASRNLWYLREFPRLAASIGVDVVHLSYPMPVRSAAFSCPTVLTLHDLYPYEIPRNFGIPKVLFNRLVLQYCLRNVDAIACVSEATRQRLGRYVSSSVWHRATKIYNCVEPPTYQFTDSPIHGWNGDPFLLCVAQHRRNKNIPLLIKTFDRLLRIGQIDASTRLVIVGITGPETNRILRLVSEYRLEERIHFLQGLTESELWWCYVRCAALVAPSITEGFGLPIAEGLLAGCRIVCSDIPAHREVGAGHCRFVDIRQRAERATERALAEAIVRELREPAPAPVRFPQFSAPVLAEQYVDLYRGLLSSQHAKERTFRATAFRASSERQSL